MVENRLVRLPTEVGCSLAGGALFAKHLDPPLVDGLISLVEGKVFGARHFLMIGHEVWQSDSRIVRFNKLWRALATRSITLPAGERSEEYPVESEAGIKFFGFIECANAEAQRILDVLQSGLASALIATSAKNPGDLLRSVAKLGWEKPRLHPPVEILKTACYTDTIVYMPVGCFDEVENGFAILAKPSWIESIFESA